MSKSYYKLTISFIIHLFNNCLPIKLRQINLQFTRYTASGLLLILSFLFFYSCGLLDTDNKGHCVSNCDDFQFMRIDKEPAWSPDRETIAFVWGSTDPNKHGIYLISPNGENLRQVYAGVAGAPSWSPDGEWLAFHQGAQIFKFHVETDSLVQLTEQGRNFHPAWSPDGEMIVYERIVSDKLGPAGLWWSEIRNVDYEC
jgi:TolB protein